LFPYTTLFRSNAWERAGAEPLFRSNAWERAGADASSAGMVDAGFENQKELTKMQLDNQKEIAEMQNETQKEIAGIQSATSRQNRSEERFSRNAETDIVCRLLLEKKNNLRGARRRRH